MFKKLAVALALLSAQQAGAAVEYGDYAKETLDTLIHDYPGRYRDTDNFVGAAQWMEDRMSPGYNVLRQDFTWTVRGQTRASQNVIAYNKGLQDDYIVTGAHFDSYYGRPTLEALDDNASGASLLTEIAHNLSGIQTERTLVFAAFGAEEEGLRGSAAMVKELEANSLTGNLKGMINMDSMITGDMLYAHAGDNSVSNPALTSLRDQLFRISEELGVKLYTNPGLDPQYPAGTGCCSDGDSFNILDIPVLYLEATNWDIGDKDGYTQTTNPAVPGGATWHSPATDNEEFLTSVFGQERITQRLHDVSLILTRLLLEWSNTDLLYSASSAGQLQRVVEESLRRQHQSLNDLHDGRRQLLSLQPREAGTWGGAVGIEGQSTPADGFDTVPQGRAQNTMAYALVDYQFNDRAVLGSSLSYQRNKDKLERDGSVKGDTWQLGVYGQLTFDNPLWLTGDLSAGRASLDTRRSVYIESGDGLALLDHTLNGHTNANFYGGRVNGGYDFTFAQLRTGPFAGLDYTHYSVDGFSDREDLRTAVDYQKQDFNSLEASLGWKISSSFSVAQHQTLLPYAHLSWVRELSDGVNDQFSIRDRAEGGLRSVSIGAPDKSFGRGGVGVQWLMGDNLSLYTDVSSRFANSDGAQTQYTVGGAFRF
ncbi:autotransporter outer membrane beta-barrel domain-containing protein [Pantoea coffeiphila]|uniref:autotransporter outer membrane beta-barrel domain-containing protein n=1 Tax=Pantoea coffeiphila TaxID=1465635 RepID=UPI0019616E14|nr:autotransporter domain-containing protein [Pantoea coffeiphila]MBM7345255.1 outer membrane autotransporter protein [Pantoea coffeiphila]